MCVRTGECMASVYVPSSCGTFLPGSATALTRSPFPVCVAVENKTPIANTGGA